MTRLCFVSVEAPVAIQCHRTIPNDHGDSAGRPPKQFEPETGTWQQTESVSPKLTIVPGLGGGGDEMTIDYNVAYMTF